MVAFVFLYRATVISKFVIFIKILVQNKQKNNVNFQTTVKPRYNALQGTDLGEHYKRESVVSGISLFAFFFQKRRKKNGEKAEKGAKLLK